MEINPEKLKEAESKGIELIILFGSQANNKASEESDYDIAVLTASEKNIADLDNYTDILFFITDALKIPGQKIDLTNINEANPLLRYNIFQKGKLLYGESIRFSEEKAFAFREYIDARPLLDLEYYLLKKRQRMFKQLIAN